MMTENETAILFMVGLILFVVMIVANTPKQPPQWTPDDQREDY